jgi:hypothetical protein
LKSLQGFAKEMAYAIDGVEGIDAACIETVRKYWNAFTAAWRGLNSEAPEMPRDIIRSVTNVCSFHNLSFERSVLRPAQFIKGPLAKELGLTTSKRPRRFATKTHLLHFARQLWMSDWFEYKPPATRLDDWLLHLANTFSSSRSGEYIESSCRLGSARGLYYRVSGFVSQKVEVHHRLINVNQDLMFGVFINEYGNPEFAVQLTRDAKNMGDRPEKR